MVKPRMNQQVLYKRVELLEMKVEELDPVSLIEIKKKLKSIENMLYASKDMLTSQEAAKYVGISLSQLYKYTCQNMIPYYKPRGKMVYFDKKELDDWMRQEHSSVNP